MFALVCESPTGAFDTHSNLPGVQKTATPFGVTVFLELLGSIRLHFFSLAGDREKKSRYRPVFELGDAGHLCGLRF